MNRRIKWISISLVVAASVFTNASGQSTQEPTSQAAKPEIKRVPAPNVNPTSGKEMYIAYCASCHGANGTGNGPAASALKTAPSDLTLLAFKNAGKFPEAMVQQAIKGDPNMPPAHGSQEMPVWGPIFSSLGKRNTAQVQLRVHNLTEYIDSLQKK